MNYKKLVWIFLLLTLDCSFAATIRGASWKDAAATETVKLSDKVPVRKPKSEKVARAWNLWIGAIHDFHQSCRDLDKPDDTFKKELISLVPDFESIVGSIEHSPPGKSFGPLLSIANKLDGSKNKMCLALREAILDVNSAYEKRLQSLLSCNIVLEGLSPATKPKDMVAAWFRYGFCHPYDVDRTIALFGRSLREKILLQEPMVNVGSNWKMLHTFFKVYYHMGRKRGKSVSETDSIISASYGVHLTKGEDECVFTEDTPQGTTRMVWRIEDSAWRLVEFSMSPVN